MSKKLCHERISNVLFSISGVMLEGCFDVENRGDKEWFPLVERVRMSPDSEHAFERALGQLSNATKPVTHVRLSIFPDGGVSRVRVYA